MALNKDEIDALAKLAKEVVKPFYDDAIKPTAVEVGQALGTVTSTINTVLTPVRLMIHGFKEIEQNLKNKLTEKFKTTPADQIKTPPLNIVGPLLEKYKYNYDTSVLSDMFVSLLANSMDSKTSSTAHPAFIDIISQLSPDEGRFFNILINAYVRPKIDISIEDLKGNGYNPFVNNFIGEGFLKDLENPDLSNLYLDNLKRLNLINFTIGDMQVAYRDEELYKQLIESKEVKEIEGKLDPSLNKIKITKGHIEITAFGRAFYKAVTRN